MVAPSFVAAMADRRLKRRDLLAFAVALDHLNFYQPLPLKVAVVSHGTRMAYPDAAAALRRLVSYGYLVAGPREGQTRTYRVAFHPHDHAA